MLEDQKIQPPVYVDTSWLLVGHVDETISFVPADTERGWKLVMNDAQMAIDMFEDLSSQGYGDVVLFEGKQWQAGVSAEITIDEVLDDDDVMGESLASAAAVDDQVAIIKNVTGITEDEIIRIPYLHHTVSGYSVAYQPGTVNGILIDQENFMPPKPHGPKIDGKDVMEKQFEEAYATVGMNVRWVEDWDLYHRLLGEVHCGSNATREIPKPNGGRQDDENTQMMTIIAGLLLSCPCVAVASGGVLGNSVDALSDATIVELEAEIEEAEAAFPDHFAAVDTIIQDAQEIDARKRGRLAPFSAMFKRLGSEAHLAMINALLFDGPQQGELKDVAWFGLRTGLIEAAGKSRDARLVPALVAYLNGDETEHYAVRAAAEALGRIGTDEAATALIRAAESRPLKKGSILSGMGTCRRLPVATYLAAELSKAKSEESKEILVKALSTVGNEYAWKTTAMQRYSEEEAPVRQMAARVLFDQYVVEGEGMIRDKALRALVVIGHEETRTWIENSPRLPNGELSAPLVTLKNRLR